MEVNQPYVNKTLQDPAKVESNEVGKLIDEIAGQVKDPNIRNSLISQSAKYKFKAANGLANRTYADTKPGIFKRAGNAIKGFFTGSKNKNQNNSNQQPQQNQNQQNNSNQTQQGQQPQQNPVAQQNQSNADHQSGGETFGDYLDKKIANNSMTGNQYATSTGLDRLANSSSHGATLRADVYNDTYDRLNVDTSELEYKLAQAKRNGNKAEVKRLQNELNTSHDMNRITSDTINDDLTDGRTMQNINNDLRNYYHHNNIADRDKNQMYKRSDDYFANQLKVLSNKRMINLDNIRFFSENTQEFVVKMYADTLTEEEMKSALKRKKLKNKVLNILKTIGKVGLAGAALYGGAKWLKNGGKDYVNKLMDKSSDFVSKTGDAAIETAKGVKDDTKNELDRTLDELAKQRLDNRTVDSFDGTSEVNESDLNPLNLTSNEKKQGKYDELNKGIENLDKDIYRREGIDEAIKGNPFVFPTWWDNKKELDDLKAKKEGNIRKAGEIALGNE